MRSRSRLFITTFLFLACYSPSYSQNYEIETSMRGDESRSFVLLQSDRKDFGFGVIKSTGVMDWQTDLPGEPLGMGKSGNDVVVFYAENTGRLSAIKAIHAAIMGINDKKILQDKVIYTNPGKFHIEPYVLSGQDDNFSCILIRTTAYNPGLGGFGGNKEDKLKITKALTKISLGKDLEPQVKEIKSIAMESDFMTTCAGNEHDLYICSFSNGQVITEKFDGNGDVKGQLAIDLSTRKKSRFYQIIQYDRLQENCIDLAISYVNGQKDDLVQLFRFDFTNKKTTATEQAPLNKDYVRSLKSAGDNSKLRHFGEIYNLQAIQLIETNEKIILLKEIESSKADGNSILNMRMGGIISIYTKDLKLLKEVAIDKSSSNYLTGFPAIYSHLKDDKLYTITNEQNGFGYETVLYVININDGSITTRRIDENKSGINWLTVPACTMWFNSNYIVPFTKAKASIHLNLETTLVSENY